MLLTSEALSGLGDVDTLSLEDIIRSKIADAARVVERAAPAHLLDSGRAKPVFTPESLRSVAGFPLLEGAKIEQISSSGVVLSAGAQKVFDRFNGFRKTFSELQQEFDFKAPELLAILTELEISGLVTSKDNFQFYFNGA